MIHQRCLPTDPGSCATLTSPEEQDEAKEAVCGSTQEQTQTTTKRTFPLPQKGIKANLVSACKKTRDMEPCQCPPSYFPPYSSQVTVAQARCLLGMCVYNGAQSIAGGEFAFANMVSVPCYPGRKLSEQLFSHANNDILPALDSPSG